MSQEARTEITAGQVTGVGEVELQAVQDLLNETPSGSFFAVHGYISKETEKQATSTNEAGEIVIDDKSLEVVDHTLQYGINYGRIKELSLRILLASMEADGIAEVDRDGGEKLEELESSVEIARQEALAAREEGDFARAAELADIADNLTRSLANVSDMLQIVRRFYCHGNDVKSIDLQLKHGVYIHPDTIHELLAARPVEGVAVTLAYGQEGYQVKATATVPLQALLAFSNRKGKGRIPVEIQYGLCEDDAILQNALVEAAKGIVAPKMVAQGYVKYADGGYYRAKNGTITLYLRDALRVHRSITHPGVWEFKASAPKTAVRNAVERLTPKGKYRAMTFEPLQDGRPRFQSISIGGVSLLMDGVSESMYFAPQDAVKESVKVAESVAAA